MNTYNTFAPLFPGFYETVFQYSGEDQDIEYYNEENNTEYEYDSFAWDYSEYENRVAKKFVARLETELAIFLPIKLEFQQVISPKEYNFTNDSINIAATLDLDELMKLIEARRDNAAIYFKDNYTSCSGFISSHSNDITDWLNKDYILENPEHRIGALLGCLCFCELNADDIIYWCDSEMHINYELKSPQ